MRDQVFERVIELGIIPERNEINERARWGPHPPPPGEEGLWAGPRPTLQLR